MHYHCEIVMPKCDDYIQQIEKIMAPFREGNDGEDASSHQFWDWYQIGGRWSGNKLRARLGEDRIDEFCAELNRRQVTVSGLQWGKQELSPASQIPEVDALWREWFPNSGSDACLLFKHAGDVLPLDACSFEEAPLDMKCERVIVAGPRWNDDNTLEAASMQQADFWNGVNHCPTTWDGTLRQAIERHAERLSSYKDEYRERHTVRPDWLVVTIDYHS